MGSHSDVQLSGTFYITCAATRGSTAQTATSDGTACLVRAQLSLMVHVCLYLSLHYFPHEHVLCIYYSPLFLVKNTTSKLNHVCLV